MKPRDVCRIRERVKLGERGKTYCVILRLSNVFSRALGLHFFVLLALRNAFDTLHRRRNLLDRRSYSECAAKMALLRKRRYLTRSDDLPFNVLEVTVLLDLLISSWTTPKPGFAILNQKPFT